MKPWEITFDQLTLKVYDLEDKKIKYKNES